MPRFQTHEGERTFYCPDAAEGVEMPLDPTEAAHAVRVLRLGVGDAVTLFDGRGRFYEAVIAQADKRSAVVRVGASHESDAEPRARVVLLVGCLKGPKTDFLIQKCVELGVAELVFFAAERSVSRPRLRTDEVSCGAGVPPAQSCGAGVPPAQSCGAAVPPASPAWLLAHVDQPPAGETPAPQIAGQRPAPQNATTGMDPRHLSIVVSACKQCGRAALMPVVVCGSLQAALARLPGDGLARFVYWEEAAPHPSPSPSPAEQSDASASGSPTFVVPALAGKSLSVADVTMADQGRTEAAEAKSFPAKAGTTNVFSPSEAGEAEFFPAKAGTTNALPPSAPVTPGAYALIGPEGGLTRAEVAQAQASGFVVRSLGRRILRAETAALAAAAILLHAAGELG